MVDYSGCNQNPMQGLELQVVPGFGRQPLLLGVLQHVVIGQRPGS